MRAGFKIMLMAAIALTAACQKQPPADQNIIMDNGVMANADIEAVPPDESSGTSTNELANGNDNPDVNAVTNNND
jgi:hypothetical protein